MDLLTRTTDFFVCHIKVRKKPFQSNTEDKKLLNINPFGEVKEASNINQPGILYIIHTSEDDIKLDIFNAGRKNKELIRNFFRQNTNVPVIDQT